MGAGNLAEVRQKWNFGSNALSEGGSTLNSTGAGEAFNAMGLGREHTFYIEANVNNSTGVKVSVRMSSC